MKRSPTLQIWSSHHLSTLSSGGTGKPPAKLDAALAKSSEDDEKLAAVLLKQLGDAVKQNHGVSGEQQEELASTHGLPLSPLMDPQMIAARNRHRTPKPQPSGPPSALREKLQKNPYGTDHPLQI